MRYCAHCGTAVSDDAEYCYNCGSKIEKSGAPAQNQKEDIYSVLSIIGLVFVFVFPLVGLIISLIAYNNAKTEGSKKSMELSRIGYILAIVFFCFELFVIILCVGIFGCAACTIYNGVYYY